MKNIFIFLKTLEKFKIHQDTIQLKTEFSEIEDIPIGPVLYDFFCEKYKTKKEFTDHVLSTIVFILLYVPAGLFLISALFNIGHALIYDLILQQNLKSSIIFLSVGILYACLGCLCFIGIFIAPFINIISIITRVILNKESILIEKALEPESKDLLIQSNLSERDRFIQKRVEEAKEKAAVDFDRLLMETYCVKTL